MGGRYAGSGVRAGRRTGKMDRGGCLGRGEQRRGGGTIQEVRVKIKKKKQTDERRNKRKIGADKDY